MGEHSVLFRTLVIWLAVSLAFFFLYHFILQDIHHEPLILLLTFRYGEKAITTRDSKISSDPNEVITKSFTIDHKKNTFLKDGKPFQYISGSIHYSRVPRFYWQDRLAKIKALGLDAIQIYIPWNYHAPEDGIYDFYDTRDVVAFIKMAQATGLLVIVRAGPYVCGEWDFGGLPGWLLRKNATMVLRSSDPQYTHEVESWFNILLPKLAPLLYENGGPVIMVQLENEYGSYPTCDKKYMGFLYNLGRKHLGNNTILFTTDGFSAGYLKCGAIDSRYFATVDFGPGSAGNPNATFRDLRKIQATGPLVNSEYYTGWLDGWGHSHQRTSAQSVTTGLIKLLSYSPTVNVNMYMIHGGTNFAFWNGANGPPELPQPTSYDYDAPISESGDITNKYYVLREAIAKFRKTTPQPLPKNTTKSAYGKIVLGQRSSIIPHLILEGKAVEATYPLTMEAFGQYLGFGGYQTSLTRFANAKAATLQFSDIGDRGYVFSMDTYGYSVTYLGLVTHVNKTLTFARPRLQDKLVVLVENSAHINYGGSMFNNVKGIIGNVTYNNTVLTDWKMVKVDLRTIPPYPSIRLRPKRPEEPVSVLKNVEGAKFPDQASIHIGLLKIAGTPNDTFIKLSNFSKGQVYINGYNLGRYWNTAGPQVTLFIPRSVLRTEYNVVQVLELEACHCASQNEAGYGTCIVEFVDRPLLDGPTGPGERSNSLPPRLARGPLRTRMGGV